ncbi:hypothetical protein ACIBIZ_44635 [Nonomuraea spiralis]|nr:hypothetical protein [Nonomuraea sp. WAC 01424]
MTNVLHVSPLVFILIVLGGDQKTTGSGYMSNIVMGSSVIQTSI